MPKQKRGPTVSDWTPARIKALRHRLNESQEEFAKRFRVTVDSVRTWEQDKGRPSGPVTVVLDELDKLPTIRKIARIH